MVVSFSRYVPHIAHGTSEESHGKRVCIAGVLTGFQEASATRMQVPSVATARRTAVLYHTVHVISEHDGLSINTGTKISCLPSYLCYFCRFVFILIHPRFFLPVFFIKRPTFGSNAYLV